MQFLKFLILCMFLLIPSFCLSQVNIESMRNDKKDKLSGFIQGGANFQKSNVDILEINSEIRLDYHIRQFKEKILFLGKYSLGSQNDKDFKNEVFSHIRLNAYPFDDTGIGAESFYQIQKDDFELLQIRQLLGGGLRLETDKKKETIFAFGLGLMADYEKIKNVQKNNFVMRSTNYISVIHKNKNINTFLVAYLQPRVIKPSDFRILSEITNEIKITKVLSFNLTVSYRYDSDTPESVVKNELKSNGSLKYSF